MTKLTIYLKSGQHFTVFVRNCEIKRNAANQFVRFERIHAEGKPALRYVDLDDISAIVTEQIADPETSETESTNGQT